MRVAIVTTAAAFANLRADWNQLAGVDPFASWEWMHGWWTELGRGQQLAIGTVHLDDKLVAVAPWYLGYHPLRGTLLQCLGSGKACTDYQRVFLADGMPADVVHDVISGLLDPRHWLKAGLPAVDAIEFEGVTAHEPTIRELEQQLVARGYQTQTMALESCWATPLPDRWLDFVAATHRGMRRKISKALRRAQDPEIAFHQADTAAELTAAWAMFVQLHQRRFAGKVRDGGCFADPRFERFLRLATLTLADRQAARLVWCTYQQTPISVQLYFLGGPTASMYQSGFDPDYSHLEPGHLLYTRVTADLIRDGYQSLDLLRGNEPYKAEWNATPIPLFRIRCIPPSTSARWRNRLYEVSRRLKHALQPPESPLETPAVTADLPLDLPLMESTPAETVSR